MAYNFLVKEELIEKENKRFLVYKVLRSLRAAEFDLALQLGFNPKDDYNKWICDLEKTAKPTELYEQWKSTHTQVCKQEKYFQRLTNEIGELKDYMETYNV